MRYITWLVAFIVVSFSHLSGQTTMAVSNCGSFADCTGYDHAVLNQMYEDGEGIHADCRMCYYVESGHQAPTDRCHPSCGYASADSKLYEHLLEAVRLGNMRVAVEVALKLPEIATFNHARSSLQITSCDGSSLVGNIPLPQQYVAWIVRSSPVAVAHR
jgi:hypothetical protein